MIIRMVFTLLVFTNCVMAQKILHGRIIDEHSKPIPYVNIGIATKGIGTVSSIDGEFKLTVPAANLSDTLSFSHVGFQLKATPINAIADTNCVITLVEASKQLNEVKIVGSRFLTKELGNRSTAGLLISGFSKGSLGGEVGSKFRIKYTPAIIESFGFHLNHNSFDSVLFRLNIYSIRKNQIHEKLAQSQPFMVKSKGPIDIDLDYVININEDIIATLEMLDHFPKHRGSVYFSQSPPYLGKMYYRETSLDVVKKYIGGPMSMYLIIKYEK